MFGNIFVPLAALLAVTCAVSVQLPSCSYKGQKYRHGEKWTDGCQYDCTCTTGTYRCTTICVEWYLPPECHLNSPDPGMCCPTPVCPHGWDINYPPGYAPR